MPLPLIVRVSIPLFSFLIDDLIVRCFVSLRNIISQIFAQCNVFVTLQAKQKDIQQMLNVFTGE